MSCIGLLSAYLHHWSPCLPVSHVFLFDASVLHLISRCADSWRLVIYPPLTPVLFLVYIHLTVYNTNNIEHLDLTYNTWTERCKKISILDLN